MLPALLAVGRIARAHGLRGRVLLAPYNADSEGLERVTALWLLPRHAQGDPKRHEVAHAERVNLGYLVSLKGIADKEAADVLRGSEALVDREELPAPGTDEIYAVDLTGMKVFDEAGAERGEVVGLENAGPNDLLQVKVAARVVLVPMGLVRSIDQEQRRLVIESPDGLFEVEA